mgnify:CR=1 FL=1
MPTACILASVGHKVIGVDINSNLIKNLNKGKINITEPGLEQALNLAIKKDNFIATSKPISSDVYLIAVPTPFKKDDEDSLKPNIDYVVNAAGKVGGIIENSERPADFLMQNLFWSNFWVDLDVIPASPSHQ